MQIVSKGLTFTYNRNKGFQRQALNGIDVTINEGDFFGIVGETGSGKSTFIQHLNGLIKVQSGSLTVGDFDLAPEDKEGKKKYKKMLKELRYKVGMVFQNPDNQMVATIVEDDIAFGPENLGIEREEIAKMIDFALKSVNMEKYKNVAGQKLSGGQ